MRKNREPTCTSRVKAVLQGCNDFMNNTMLRAATGCNINQVSAACHELRKYRVVDCVIEKDGVAWWFALPPEYDQRIREVNERVVEVKPRRPRKRKEK